MFARASVRQRAARVRTAETSRPRAWQTLGKEQGQLSSSAANQASTSSASRRARGVLAPALLCRSSNAPSSTASISRFSGGSAAEGRKNCSGRIVSGTTPGPSADPNAESIIGSGRMAYAVLVDDDDLSGHVLVPAATEHVASKLEPARAVRDDADARHPAGLEVGADIELGYFEAVFPIQRGDFKDDRDAFLERDLARVVLEPLRRHVHDLFRPGRNGGLPAGRHPDGSQDYEGRHRHPDDSLHRSALLDRPLGECDVVAASLRLDGAEAEPAVRVRGVPRDGH